MTQFGISLLAALGVLAQVAIVVILIALVASAVSAGGRRVFQPLLSAVGRSGAWLAWVAALVATLGSLFLSEVAHFAPCHLCWWQRYFMYPLVIVLIAVALMRRWWLTLAAIVIPVIGGAISARHIWIELNPSAETAQCRRGVSCAFKWIDEFGYITIPVLAGTAFLLIIVLLAITGVRQLREARGSRGAGVTVGGEGDPPA